MLGSSMSVNQVEELKVADPLLSLFTQDNNANKKSVAVQNNYPAN